MNPLLRWAGSKRKVLCHLRKSAPPEFDRYFEPFAGSAVLFFNLLPERAVLGDLNPEVAATYLAIRDEPHDVSKYLYSIPKDRESYNCLRDIKPETLSAPQRAARLIFLMKACFNGVYRTNQSGKFNVPLGNKFFALPTPDEIFEAADALKDVRVICGDFTAAIQGAAKRDFVYLDPPYSDGSRFRGEYSYRGSFQAQDQERLIEVCHDLKSRGVKVLLSFKECEAMTGALKGWKFQRLEVSRSVAGFTHARRKAREILAYSY